MSDCLRLHAFPANEGDCLLIEYGDSDRPHRVLIDGGRLATYRDHLGPFLADLKDGERKLELMVVSHIDRDHIEGALALLQDANLTLAADDIWFNAFSHLEGKTIPVVLPDNQIPVLSAKHGELLTAAIRQRKWPWNKAFDGAAVALGNDGKPVRRQLAGGATIHLLSPSREKLAALIPAWRKECARAEIVPGLLAVAGAGAAGQVAVLAARDSADLEALADRKTPDDTAPANGSSIAFLFEYGGWRLLLAADAHPGLLLDGLRAYDGGKAVSVALFKLSHHGSKSNMTRDLGAAITFEHALVSTSGSQFSHPDQEALARVILAGDAKNVHFNYRNDITGSWDNDPLMKKYGYLATYPMAANGYFSAEFTKDGLQRLK